MAEARWLEVSLLVSGELAEAVAEVLDRYASNGVVYESGVGFANDEDEGHAAGPVKVSAFLPVDEYLEGKRQELAEALWHLGQIMPLPEATYCTIEDEDWMAAWKKNYHPIPIGKKLLILPAWIQQEDQSRVAVMIDPSMAFGTGTHPTTQLCLEMVEKYVQPGQTVIDVGCGSGILSIAALKLGASQALGVDIDSASIRSTRENAAANEVTAKMEVGLGSVGEVLAGQFSLKASPIVLANILAPVIIRLFDGGLAELAAPGGLIALSGILDTQAQAVRAAAEAKGLTFVEQAQIADWVVIVYRKPA